MSDEPAMDSLALVYIHTTVQHKQVIMSGKQHWTVDVAFMLFISISKRKSSATCSNLADVHSWDYFL